MTTDLRSEDLGRVSHPHPDTQKTCNPDLLRDEIFVAGRWVTGEGSVHESVNPCDGSVFATLHTATEADVDRAVTGAREALGRTGWAQWLPHERAQVLRRIGDEVEAAADDISALQTLDTGKTRGETKALALSAAATFRYVAAALETLEDAVTPSRGEFVTVATWDPIGVVGAITPWNSPIASDAQKIAPALAAGNAVISKPPLWAPWVTLFLARIATRAGLPEGLLSVLPGPGRTVGETLVAHPEVGKVTFTGGTETGRHLAHVAADKLMPVTLELGGKSPSIVFDDADLTQTIAGLLYGVFSSSGQSCIAGSRIFVQDSIFDQVRDKLVRATAALRVGPGTDPRSQVAPMICHSHRDQVARMVDEAVASGAEVLVGGGIPTDPALAAGAYFEPTILAGVTNSDPICQEEIFGPVAVLLPFSDEEDLIAQANDTVYGLASGVWTRDLRKAWRIGRRLEAGTVYVNTYKQFSISTPFAGRRDSGLGVEKGREGIRSYMNQKSIYLDTSAEPLPWAAEQARAVTSD